MKYNILIILIISLFINELRSVNCPAGTQTADGNNDVNLPADLVNCVNCRPNFYFNGGSASGQARGNETFDANNGVRGQCVPCQINRDGSPSTAGADATLALQCSITCPTGTALDNGVTLTFDVSATQCVKCQSNFYYNGGALQGQARGNDAFAAGSVLNGAATPSSKCVPCQINRDASPATAGADATLALQCSITCPTGTALDNGVTLTFDVSATQCVKCQSNFYYNGGAPQGQARGNDAFAAGSVLNGAATPSSKCVSCQINRDASPATAGADATLALQCSITCPTGTALDNGVALTFDVSATQCVKCQSNFYFDGNFEAGKSQCIKCPINKTTPTAAPGSNASITAQCNVQCPAGTVVDDGTTANFKISAVECTKCSAGFYASKTTGFTAGTDTCTECTKKLTSGATAKVYAEATQKAQCASSTFAQFLSISLLLISFYLL